ncbi:hypothetical protein RFI_33386, partial [Reticulomyxa filosa]
MTLWLNVDIFYTLLTTAERHVKILQKTCELIELVHQRSAGNARKRFYDTLYKLFPMFSLQFMHTSLQYLVEVVLARGIRSKVRSKAKSQRNVHSSEDSEDNKENAADKEKEEDNNDDNNDDDNDDDNNDDNNDDNDNDNNTNEHVNENEDEKKDCEATSSVLSIAHWLRLCYHSNEEFVHFVCV